MMSKHAWCRLVLLLSLGAALSTTATVALAGQTFVVYPTGGDDTASIQSAFDAAVAAGPGSTVQLTGGTFTTSFIDVEGFDGYFKGAGQGVTIVTIAGPPERLACAARFAQGKWADLFTFRGGDVRISDLTFEIPNPEPCDEWGLLGRVDLHAVVIFSGPTTNDCSAPSPYGADSAVERVEFIAAECPVYSTSNVFVHLAFEGQACDCWPECPYLAWPLTGTFSVLKSSFRGATVGLGAVSRIESSLTVGAPAAGNSFESQCTAVIDREAAGSMSSISHNAIVDARFFGVLVYQSPQFVVGVQLPASQVSIDHNRIEATQFADGVWLEDPGPSLVGRKTLEIAVSSNDVDLGNTEYGGIGGNYAQDVIVANNRIAGNGLAGIYSILSSGWTLVGNNVQRVASLAPIYLGSGTNHWVVTGGSTKTNVVNLGTDNTLVGVNNMQDNPPGPDIQKALERKHEILRMLRMR